MTGTSINPKRSVVREPSQLGRRQQKNSLASVLPLLITREIYLHAIPEEQRRAVESVEWLVFGPKRT